MASKYVEEDRHVDLAFVEECDPRLLRSHYFPSKVGGKPAWLSLTPLPTNDELSCPKCNKPLTFLLQVYAPRESRADAFHRTLFVFVCRNSSCCSLNDNQCFRVFRSQLPKENDFFSPHPPPDEPCDQNSTDVNKFQSLCVVCGCAGSKTCGRCHKQNYCSREHQTIHWKAGHKRSCSQENSQTPTSIAQDSIDCCELFPEFELVIEREDFRPDTEEKDEAEALAQYQEYLKTSQAQSESDQYSKEELEEMAARETEDDKQFHKFKKRISHEPEQVLRYCKGGEPLWVSSCCTADCTDIPKCFCGADREFEFQIMPQLLNYLHVDSTGTSLDWGTVCIYTCRDSCGINKRYVSEFIWKQDFPPKQ